MRDWIKNKLTFENPAYESANMLNNNYKARFIPQYLTSFEVVNKYIIIDRGFLYSLTQKLLREKIAFRIIDHTVERKANFKFDAIQLRPYQNKAVKKCLDAVSGVFVMPCGAGKSITSLELIRQLNQWTLIIVHTHFIMQQWIDYIKDHLNYDVGIIQGPNKKYRKITIAMKQTLHDQVLDDKFLEKWGCIIVDEVHHEPADSYRELLNQFPAKYRFGTTATVTRSDGLTKMLYASVGPVIYRMKPQVLAKLGYILIPKVIKLHSRFMGHGGYQSVIKQLIFDNNRNDLIINILNTISSHVTLLLSDRIDHITLLARKYGQTRSDYRVVVGDKKRGGVSKQERIQIIDDIKSGKIRVIFATNLADEGLDIPNLEALVLAFPTKALGRIEQRIGRLQRISPDKLPPVVYDIVDPLVTRFIRFSGKRDELYRSLDIKVSNENQRFKETKISNSFVTFRRKKINTSRRKKRIRK